MNLSQVTPSAINSFRIDFLVKYGSGSFYQFVKRLWSVVEPARAFKDNWHIKEICDKCQSQAQRIAFGLPRDKNLIINVSPGSTKSTIVSVMFPAWCWVNWPWMKFITGSFDSGLALRDAVKSRDVINSELYQSAFGRKFQFKYDVNKKSEYANDKGGFRVATSVGGSIMGYHADIWIIDDPLDPKGSRSKAEVKQVKDWLDFTIPTRLTDLNVSVQILIMQRLSDNDPTGYLLAKSASEYEHVCMPAELTPDVKPVEYREFYKGGLFDPERLSRKILDRMKIPLGAKGYAAQYLQRPAPVEGNLFKLRWFEYFQMRDLDRISSKLDKPIIWQVRVDTAYTEKTQNDPSGFMSFCEMNNNLYIRDYTPVWKQIQDLTDFCNDFARRNDYSDQSTFKVEPKASGISLIQLLKSFTKLNVTQAPTMRGKHGELDKISKANLIIPYVESGHVFLLDGAGWVDSFLHEITTFPDAVHDESLDLLAMAISEYIFDKPSSGGLLGMVSIGND